MCVWYWTYNHTCAVNWSFFISVGVFICTKSKNCQNVSTDAHAHKHAVSCLMNTHVYVHTGAIGNNYVQAITRYSKFII